MTSFSDIFELMKNSLELSDTARSIWIDPIKPVKLNNNKVVLYIADSYIKKVVEENHDKTVDFINVPDAQQYRETVMIRKRLEDKNDGRAD